MEKDQWDYDEYSINIRLQQLLNIQGIKRDIKKYYLWIISYYGEEYKGKNCIQILASK